MKDLSLLARAENFANIIRSTDATPSTSTEAATDRLISLLIEGREQGRALYIIGNGGSAAVASHALTDFINVCRLRAFTLHESSLMTCMANDYGYEHAFRRVVTNCMRPDDILICISSSGKSANIINAAKAAKEAGGFVVTFTGFSADNPLRKTGDMNFWLNSNDYGFVEVGHLFLLHNVSDRIGQMEKAEDAVINI